LKIGVLRGDIEKPETLELTEEPLVGPEMRNEMIQQGPEFRSIFCVGGWRARHGLFPPRSPPR
jgi:hypothetical protein